MLAEKTTAPDFELPDQNAVNHRLSDYLDKLNIKILGISADPTSSHFRFAEKYKLNFTLLSDDKKEVIKKYEAEGIFTKRISYLIDPQGQIYKSYPDVKPNTHAEEVLSDLKTAGAA